MAPALVHKVDREPVEQLKVFGRAGAGAEVFRCLEEAHPEEGLPDPVDGYARGQRGPAVDEPAGETEAVAGRVLGPRVQGGRHVGRDGVLRAVPSPAVEQTGLAGMDTPAFAQVQHGGGRGGVALPRGVGLSVKLAGGRFLGAPRAEQRGLLPLVARVGGYLKGQHRGVVHRRHARVRRAGQGDAGAAERGVVPAIVVTAVVHPQQHAELGARGVAEWLRELQDGRRFRVAPAGAAVRAPRRVVGAVDHELRRSDDPAPLLVVVRLPFLLEAADRFREVRRRTPQRHLLPLVAARRHHAYLQFAERPRPVLAAAGAVELKVPVRERFEAEAGDAVERRGSDYKDIPAGGRVSEGEDGVVSELDGMVEAAGAGEFLGDQRRPGGPLTNEFAGPALQPLRPIRDGGLGPRVDGGEVPAEGLDELLLLGRVDPGLGLVGRVEEGVEAEVLVVGDRIEFVRVALRALEAEADGCLADAIEAVEHSLDTELLGDDRALLVDHPITQEASGDDLFLSGAWEQVAGDLLHQEAVVAEVAVEGADHPVPPGPLLAREVLLVAVAVSVTGGVEPDPGPAFAEALVGDEAASEVFGGRGQTSRGGREHEGSDLRRRRWQANEIEMQAAAEHRGISGRREIQLGGAQPRRHEGIDGVRFSDGGRRLHWRHEGPMRGVGSAGFDPPA